MKRVIFLMALIIGIGPAWTGAEELFDTEAARTHFNTGMGLYFKKDYPGAVAEFEKAVEIDPENAKAHYFMGYSYYKMGDMERAMVQFDRAYAMDKQYTPIGQPGAEEPAPDSFPAEEPGTPDQGDLPAESPATTSDAPAP